MNCVACARDLPEGAAFCPSCGTPQAAPSCHSCGGELISGAAFCFKCGTPVPGVNASAPPAPTPEPVSVPQGSERRQTSVLFADLVSYTTLAESRDTEDVRDLLSRYFEVCSTVVRRYGGTIEKFIGDAVMAVWGVPTAHEDDAERAVRAALELINEVAELGVSLGVPELALRAGVVTGEVAANLGATGQGMVAGDAVNTAARVQGVALPGEVWVDSATRSLTAAAVTHVDVGLHELKGKAEPMQLYRVGTVVAAVGGSQRVDGLEAPLAGRERELRMVKELFHSTVESGRPRLVILDGEAGTGKSRLGWEFEKYTSALETNTRWHRGRCLSYGEGVAYWALAEAVRTRLGLLEDTAETNVSAHVDEALKAWVPNEEERAWLVPRLVALVGGAHGDFDREDLFAAWTAFFERLADEAEAVSLVIDDAQYADQGLADFLEHVVAHARAPMFVLLLARPELLEARPGLAGRRATRVSLEPLNDVAMDRLVSGLVDGLPDQARAALVKRAEGIPLYAVETVRNLIDREIVRPEGGRYVVAPGEVVDLQDIAAPPSLHALVASRLDALSAEERRVVADASVLGTTFTREGIEFLCDDVPELERVLATLQRKELIGTDNDRFSAERGQFRFVQAVVRQVAYSTLSRRARKERHLAVATHLETIAGAQGDLSVVAAQHLLDAIEAAGPEDPDVPDLNRRAASLLMVAGERLAGLGSHAAAVAAFRQAAGRMGDEVERARALLRASQAADAMYDARTAQEVGSAARDLFAAHGAIVDAARAASLVARSYMTLGQPAEGLQQAQSSWDSLVGTTGAEDVQTWLAITIAQAMNKLEEDPKEVMWHVAEALRLSEACGDPQIVASAMRYLAVHQTARGSSRVAMALTRDLIDIARAGDQWKDLVNALLNQSLLVRIRDLREGLRLVQESSSIGRQHGMKVEQIDCNVATNLWASGQWAEHATLLRKLAEEWESVPGPDQVLMYATDVWRRDAGLEGILQPSTGSFDELNWRSWDCIVRAWQAAARGASGEAAQLAQECLNLTIADAGLTDDYPLQMPRAMWLCLAAGDLAAAETIIGQLENTPKGLDSAGLRAYERTFRGLLGLRKGVEVEAAEAEARLGISNLETYGATPDRALAQEDLGRWLVEQGRSLDAEPLLEAARATFTELGATAWLARLDTFRRVG